jgi:hypothetical protein
MKGGQMDDTQKKEIEQKEANQIQDKGNSTGNTDERKPTLIEDANLAAERLEKANKEHRELLERHEALLANQRLGGRAEAGIVQEKPKEETPQEYAKKLFEGKIPLK